MPAHFFKSILITTSLVAPAAVHAQDSDSVVEPGKTVAIEYTMSRENGSVLESNVGAEPLEYVHGQSQLFPQLEKELEGMSVDERRSVTLEAEDAFGPRDPGAVQEVPKEQVPPEAQEVGAELAVAGLDWPVLVREIRTDVVVLDLNHPLAGETLKFDVRVLSII